MKTVDPNHQIDFVIVGAGAAGGILTWEKEIVALHGE
jgi:hypothetical protein